MAKDVGVIQEQGDLGLGWEPVSEKEQRQIKEHEEQNKERQNAFHS